MKIYFETQYQLDHFNTLLSQQDFQLLKMPVIVSSRTIEEKIFDPFKNTEKTESKIEVEINGNLPQKAIFQIGINYNIAIQPQTA